MIVSNTSTGFTSIAMLAPCERERINRLLNKAGLDAVMRT